MPRPIPFRDIYRLDRLYKPGEGFTAPPHNASPLQSSTGAASQRATSVVSPTIPGAPARTFEITDHSGKARIFEVGTRPPVASLLMSQTLGPEQQLERLITEIKRTMTKTGLSPDNTLNPFAQPTQGLPGSTQPTAVEQAIELMARKYHPDELRPEHFPEAATRLATRIGPEVEAAIHFEAEINMRLARLSRTYIGGALVILSLCSPTLGTQKFGDFLSAVEMIYRFYFNTGKFLSDGSQALMNVLVQSNEIVVKPLEENGETPAMALFHAYEPLILMAITQCQQNEQNLTRIGNLMSWFWQYIFTSVIRRCTGTEAEREQQFREFANAFNAILPKNGGAALRIISPVIAFHTNEGHPTAVELDLTWTEHQALDQLISYLG